MIYKTAYDSTGIKKNLEESLYESDWLYMFQC